MRGIPPAPPEKAAPRCARIIVQTVHPLPSDCVPLQRYTPWLPPSNGFRSGPEPCWVPPSCCCRPRSPHRAAVPLAALSGRPPVPMAPMAAATTRAAGAPCRRPAPTGPPAVPDAAPTVWTGATSPSTVTARPRSRTSSPSRAGARNRSPASPSPAAPSRRRCARARTTSSTVSTISAARPPVPPATVPDAAPKRPSTSKVSPARWRARKSMPSSTTATSSSRACWPRPASPAGPTTAAPRHCTVKQRVGATPTPWCAWAGSTRKAAACPPIRTWQPHCSSAPPASAATSRRT